VLTLEDQKGKAMAEATQKFSMSELGQQTLEIPLAIPSSARGKCTLKASAHAQGGREPTQSRRWVTVENSEP